MVTLSPFAGATLLAAVISAAIGFVTWRNRTVPGARTFTVVMAGGTLYAGSYGVGLLLLDPELSKILEISFWLGGELLTVGWLFFALEYTGRGEYLTRRNVALVSIIPVLTIIVVATNGYHQLFWRDYRIIEVFGAGVRVLDRGPWLYFKTLYAVVLIGAGYLMLLEEIFVEKELYRDQSLALILGSVISLAAYGKWTLELGPYPHVDFSPMLFSVTGVLFGYAIFRAELFEATPAVRRLGQRTAIDDFTDAVVMIDSNRRVAELNDAASRMMARPRDEILGKRLDELLDEPLEFTRTTQTVSLDTADGHRTFEVSISEMADRHDQRIGHTLVFHDITDRQRRKQRLQVLNRALRHNLRNDMNVVRAFANQLAEETGEPHATHAEKIVDQSNELIGLGEKAREAERLLGDEPKATRTVNLAELVDDMVAQARSAYPEATVTVESEVTSSMVETVPELLEAAVWNLLENAAEHGDMDEPIRLRLENSETGRVEISVSDGGPGIPEHERNAILEGEETSLQHGSGIGLWITRWSASRLGGELEIERNDRGGTTATITLLRMEEGKSAASGAQK